MSAEFFEENQYFVFPDRFNNTHRKNYQEKFNTTRICEIKILVAFDYCLSN